MSGFGSASRLADQVREITRLSSDGRLATLYNRQMRDTKKDPETIAARHAMASTPSFGG